MTHFLALVPLIWEIINDRNGDSHLSRGIFKKWNISSKKIDVGARIIIALIGSIINYLFTGIPIWRFILLAGAIHFFFFDYIIAYILIKKGIIQGHWLSYMGSGSIDSSNIWRNRSPKVRLIIRIIVLIIATYLYCNELH